jgi:hypothetical protein
MIVQPEPDNTLAVRAKILMQVGVSVVVLIVACIMIFVTKDIELKFWAIGAIGTVLGYWLR